jgi:hypothetical protein
MLRIRGIGRPQKIDRQEIMGVVASVQRWLTLNHEDRLAEFESKSQEILTRLQGIPGVTAWLNPNIMGHMPYGVFLTLDKDVTGMDIDGLVQRLKDGDPSIWTRRALDGADRLDIHVFGLVDGESELVGTAMAKILKG